jgi:hypothetical protein
MEIIDINSPPGDSGDFYCPFTGELQMDDVGATGPSCVAYIPPPAFADARIACRHFEKFWDKLLGEVPEETREQLVNDLDGDLIKGYLENYSGHPSQKLIGFRIKTTTIECRVAPEFDEPIHTLPFFYIVDFWCKSRK